MDRLPYQWQLTISQDVSCLVIGRYHLANNLLLLRTQSQPELIFKVQISPDTLHSVRQNRQTFLSKLGQSHCPADARVVFPVTIETILYKGFQNKKTRWVRVQYSKWQSCQGNVLYESTLEPTHRVTFSMGARYIETMLGSSLWGFSTLYAIHCDWARNYSSYCYFSLPYMVSHFCAGKNNLSEDMTALLNEISMSYLPWVGAACPLGSTVSANQPTGHIFCFLPLPLQRSVTTIQARVRWPHSIIMLVNFSISHLMTFFYCSTRALAHPIW